MTISTFTREILRGKDLYRILMNRECEKHTLRGLVVDVGGGAGSPSYFRFFRKEAGVRIEVVDLAAGNGKRVDLETDRLPFGDASADTVLALNVLEHIYRYGHAVSEMRRVLKEGGSLIVVVPFLVNYHPDPHDYWRYTKESLQRILSSAGFREVHIQELGTGPCAASYSQKEWLIPSVCRLLSIPVVFALDRVVRMFRPRVRERFPLGFFVTARI